MLGDRCHCLGSARADRRLTTVAAVVLLSAILAAGCGGGAKASGGPAVRTARATLSVAPPLSAYRGPPSGPTRRPPALVVFVASDLTDGGIAAVARGAQQAAAAIGWPLQILNGQANASGETDALRLALRERPGGIILGGFDAAQQQAALRQARAQGIPVVGWHAAPRPGPDPNSALFTNVEADPAALARLAADYLIANSNGTAGVAIFADPESGFDQYVSDLMQADIGKCQRCSVLKVVNTPVATAAIDTVALLSVLLNHFGARLSYLLSVNDSYIEGASAALIGAGRRGDEPPFSIAVGEGDESEFARIRAGDYEKASIAEPLNLEGWQLIDELNRARAGQPPSGYVAPPRLITQSDVPNGGAFDPPSGYRQNYLRIWDH